MCMFKISVTVHSKMICLYFMHPCNDALHPYWKNSFTHIQLTLPTLKLHVVWAIRFGDVKSEMSDVLSCRFRTGRAKLRQRPSAKIVRKLYTNGNCGRLRKHSTRQTTIKPHEALIRRHVSISKFATTNNM